MNKLNNTDSNISKVTDVKRNLRRNHEADNPCLKVLYNDEMLFIVT